MSPVLEAHELYRFFHTGDTETLALRGVSLALDAGELVAVMGPSGSGKSTLLACLAGLDDPDGGTVRVAGAVMSRRPEAERAALRARTIAMLFQSDNLFDHLSVHANVAMVRSLAARRSAGRDPDGDVLTRLGLAHRTHAYPSQLSGGESARAGLAVALANAPAVVIADEPTGELDSTTATMVLDELARQTARGIAVLVVTHSAAVAQRADRVVRLADGRTLP